MAGSKSAYLSKKILDLVLSATAYSIPGTVYAALSTTAFDATATGSAMDEVTGGSYARVSITNNATNWPAASSSAPSTKANANDVTFPTATADWGTPLAVYLADASSAGNILYGCDLTASSDVAIGDTFVINAGTFIFSED